MYAQRRQALIERSRNHLSTLKGTTAAFHQLLLLPEGDPLHEDIYFTLCDFVDSRHDCSDFALHSLIRLLYQFPDKLTPALAMRIKETVLGFKYWPDEPGTDSLCTWSENHHILFASGAYLVGQLFPNETFTNSGHIGQQKMDITRPRILRWLDLRFHTGFSEWLSNVYYDEDLIALLGLVDFCEDAEVRYKASTVISLMLLDMAINSFQGVFGSTHGRSYEHHKKWARRDSMASTIRLLFGTGDFETSFNLSAPCFALSQRYVMPGILREIAKDETAYTNRQRMGIKLSEAERWGLNFNNFDDGMTFLSLEAYLHPRTANLTVRMLDAFNWWKNDFFKDISKYRKLLNGLRRFRILSPLMRVVERDVCRNTREEVNIITHRTAHFMLSSAVDYRAGYGGDQQHIWQATLGPDAVCFTAHPAKREKPTPDYWTGEGTLPRVAQIDNVLVAVYKINPLPGLYVTNRLMFTHAWLPHDKFDEVHERDGWLFARKGSGFLALCSRNPYYWNKDPDDEVASEVIADGKTNIWICELGSRVQYGSFKSFVNVISEANRSYQRLSVVYDSPSQGRLEFGWRRRLRHNGNIIQQRDFSRYDNPFMRVAFPPDRIEITHGDTQLTLEYEST